MKKIIIAVPYLLFTTSLLMLAASFTSEIWVIYVMLFSFVISLFLIPWISRHSLKMGYIALIWTMLSFMLVFVMGSGICDYSSADVSEQFVNNAMKAPLLKYRMDTGSYPDTEEGLKALIECPEGKEDRWKGPYIGSMPHDPWNNPYQYRCPGVHNPESYDLWSLGQDGKVSEDDTGNWWGNFHRREQRKRSPDTPSSFSSLASVR